MPEPVLVSCALVAPEMLPVKAVLELAAPTVSVCDELLIATLPAPSSEPIVSLLEIAGVRSGPRLGGLVAGMADPLGATRVPRGTRVLPVYVRAPKSVRVFGPTVVTEVPAVPSTIAS